jgi:hypothetical protein
VLHRHHPSVLGRYSLGCPDPRVLDGHGTGVAECCSISCSRLSRPRKGSSWTSIWMQRERYGFRADFQAGRLCHASMSCDRSGMPDQTAERRRHLRRSL